MDKFKTVAEIVLQLLEILSWPIIVMIGIYILKNPITNLLGRIKEIGYGDKTVTIEQNDDQIRPTEKIEPQNMGIFSEETEASADAFIKSNVDLENGDDKDRIEKLLAFSKLYVTLNRFEWLYNNIFGSQIRILDTLNTVNETSKEYLKKHYDYVASRNSEIFSNYDYESYLDFLRNNGLIKNVDNEKVSITGIGQDFLLYLVRHRKDKQKPF